MGERQPEYLRESADRRFAAWYVESWYYGHHYRFFSCSPWHLVGSGTRYRTEAETRAAVDWYMEVWVPRVLQEHVGSEVAYGNAPIHRQYGVPGCAEGCVRV
jgi:hypothetical protein